MSNPDRPRGFRLWGYACPPTPYDRDATSATPICIGDAVTINADGNVNAAGAGEVILGVARDFATGSAAKTNIMIWDDPNQRFIAQDDGVGATPAQTNIGDNEDHVAGTGSVLTKLSAHELDASSVTTVAAGFRICAFVTAPNNEVATTEINVETVVFVNEHVFGITETAVVT